MFRRIIDPNNFKRRMVFPALFLILVLSKARSQFVPEISWVSCEFDASDCDWRHFRDTSDWKISNSTLDSDIPDNGQNFLLLRGVSDKAKLSIIISPHFRILPRNISLKQTIFCSGSPQLELYFYETSSREQEILTEISCSEGEYWEETENHSEADPDDPEVGEINVGFQVLLAGIVKYGDVIAIQNLRFKDETAIVTESPSTSTENSMKNETTTTSLSTVSSTNLTSESELNTIGTTFTYLEINSTGNSNFSSISSLSTTEDYQRNTSITSLLPEYKSTEENTRKPLVTTPEYPSTEESTRESVITTPGYISTEESTRRPLVTTPEYTSTEETSRGPLVITPEYTSMEETTRGLLVTTPEYTSMEETTRGPLVTTPEYTSMEETTRGPLVTTPEYTSMEETTRGPLVTTPEYTSMEETTRGPLVTTTEYTSTEERTKGLIVTTPEYTSTEESTRGPVVTKVTSTGETINSPVTGTKNYTDSVSDVTEYLSTENNTFTSSQVSENQTDNSSVSRRLSTFSSQSEDKDPKSTTSASTEDSTSTRTTDSGKESQLIQKDEFLWRTVFISTLTAFFVYSLLSLLVRGIRKLMRRRKQWMLGRRSKNTNEIAENREVIPLSVISRKV